MEYDDEHELTRYVFEFFCHVMTEFEAHVGWWAGHAEAKAAIGHPDMARFIYKRHGLAGDPRVEAALADGVEAFRRRVCKRVLAEHRAEIFVNRCPACNRIVRTPRARQCFWCGHDWHRAAHPE